MEETVVSAEDLELGRVLVAQGWRSISNRHLLVARWREPVPKLIDLLRPECLASPHVDRMIKAWDRYNSRQSDLRSQHPLVERRQLTASQFAAFRRVGGSVA